MLGNVDSQVEQVVDARGPGRFAGSEAEPRQGVRSGHIPRSVNVPFTQACFLLMLLSDIHDDGSQAVIGSSKDTWPGSEYGHNTHICCMTDRWPPAIIQGER